jgi:hypothetical protein
MSPSIKIERQELYDLVWSNPVIRIAKDLGVSDVAVGKICKKLNIPKPGLGYWAKKQAGKRVRQTPLPNPQPGDPETYTIKGYRDSNQNPTSELIEKQKTFESTGSNKIIVKKTLRNPHPLVKQTLQRKKAYDSASYHEWNSLPPGLSIAVGSQSFQRAIRIMDALLKAMEKREYEIKATSGYDGYTSVSIDGEEFIFDIFEFSKNVANPKWKQGSFDKQYILERTGKLSLRIKNFYWGQKSINDGKLQRLEEKLNDYILLLVKASVIKKINRKEREQREQEYEEEQRKIEEARLVKQREQERLNQLFDNAASWNKCKQAREYIAAVKENSEGDEVDAWVDWAIDCVYQAESLFMQPDTTLRK